MPKKNQLFKMSPDIHIIGSLLSVFGLDDLEDGRYFSREYLKENQVVPKMKALSEELKDYYIPCKQRNLLNLSEKRSITILRQFIKPFGYKCQGTEKSVDGSKTMMYQLLVIEREELSPKKADKREYILSFD
jgi:hypothetical protein